MEFLDEGYGFEALFISEVPEYLQCEICHLVLRDAVQISECGHKFCNVCFERLKSYCKNNNSELSCPIDREIIDVNNVFADKGIARVVGNLRVKCSNCEAGCTWEGDLRNLNSHVEKCEHAVHKESDQSSMPVEENLLKELFQRMSKYEETLSEKEKDVAFLKYNVQEVMTKLNENLDEVDLLKDQNRILESEVKFLKNENHDLKQVEIRMENLLLKNMILEQKIDSLEKQSLVSKKQLDDNTMITEAVKNEVKDVRAMIEETKTATENCEAHFSQQVKELQSTITDDKQEISASLEKSLKNQCDEISLLSSRVTNTEKQIHDKTLNNNQTLIQDSQEKMKDLESHVTNIENILFCNPFTGSKDIVLQWHLQYYKYHFELGEDVSSPLYFTQVKGYSFQLVLSWTGKKKENIGIHLRVYRAKDYNKPLEPYDIPYSIEMCDKKGNLSSIEVTLDEIEEHRKNCFTIFPGKDYADEDCGSTNFLTIPEMRHYIVNDAIRIKCKLMPPYMKY